MLVLIKWPFLNKISSVGLCIGTNGSRFSSTLFIIPAAWPTKNVIKSSLSVSVIVFMPLSNNSTVLFMSLWFWNSWRISSTSNWLVSLPLSIGILTSSCAMPCLWCIELLCLLEWLVIATVTEAVIAISPNDTAPKTNIFFI